ncbi:MAG: hypothetical protein HY319_00240 [Armatimonadetes bacterium]|nr:hypothetical protein [Armatimonadota bacterium]
MDRSSPVDECGEAPERATVDDPTLVVVDTNEPMDRVAKIRDHQAKGLEARVVSLASPTGGFPLRADYRLVRAGGQATGFLSIWNHYQTFAQPPDWEDHENAELDYMEAERCRLLYVAATRAQELLVVGTVVGKPWICAEAEQI